MAEPDSYVVNSGAPACFTRVNCMGTLMKLRLFREFYSTGEQNGNSNFSSGIITKFEWQLKSSDHKNQLQKIRSITIFKVIAQIIKW